MALIDSEGAPPSARLRTPFGQWPTRAKAWLTDRSDTSRAQRMAGAAFLIRVASAAVAYFSQVLLARWMGEHEFGIYVYVWTWALLFGGIVDLGLSAAAQRFIPEYTEGGALGASARLHHGEPLPRLRHCHRDRRRGVRRIWLLRDALDHYVVIPLFLACLVLPFYALTNVQDGIARSYNWVHLALLPPYILRPLLLIVLMVAGFLSGLPADATTAMAAAVVATWATQSCRCSSSTGGLRAKCRPARRATRRAPGLRPRSPSSWSRASICC